MRWKTECTRDRENFAKNGMKVFSHFCLLPRVMDYDNRVTIWLSHCYKVLDWQTHGGGGNSFWRYYSDLNTAREKAKANELF